jgi:hypothetical protein
MTLSPEVEHTFEARLSNADGERLMRITSDKYAIQGFDFIRSNGGESTRPGMHVAAVAAAAGMLLGGL